MSTDKLLVLIGGALAISFVYWFFLKRKETVKKVAGLVEILVEGGYRPESIQVQKGKSITMRFLRKDPSSCLDDVVLPDFKVRKELPLNSPVDITIKPEQIGEFTYSCGMNMYHGKIIVQE